MDYLRTLQFLILDRKTRTYGPVLSVNSGANAIYLGRVRVNKPNAEAIQSSFQALENLRSREIHTDDRSCTFCSASGEVKVLSKTKQIVICTFELSRIVLSCVDAQNQDILAVFYHYGDRLHYGSSLECHVFRCSDRVVAKDLAMRLGNALISSYERRRQGNDGEKEVRTIARYVTCGDSVEKEDPTPLSDLVSLKTNKSISQRELQPHRQDNTLWWEEGHRPCFQQRLIPLSYYVKLAGYLSLLLACGVGFIVVLSLRDIRKK